MPIEGDVGAIIDYFARNSDHFCNAMPRLPNDFFDVDYQISRIKNHDKLNAEGKFFRYYAYLKKTPEKIIGDVSIANVLKENLSCQISYKVDNAFLRLGIAFEMCSAVIRVLFSETNLRRIELYTSENNIASIKLAKKLGFTKEGVARKYMKINNKWLDHIQFSLLKEDYES